MNAFALALLLAASPAPAATPAAAAVSTSSPEAAALATKVQKTYNGLFDYNADFSQTITMKNAPAAGPKSTGHVWIKKGGKMRWEFVSPEKKTIVSDGKSLWMYDPEENQVIEQDHLEQSTSVTALNFLEGLGDVTKDFDVALGTLPADAAAKDGQLLVLTPKPDSDIQLSRLELEIDKKGLADEVFLVDGLGTVTRITFIGGKPNMALKDDRFTFDIPKGAEVIKPNLSMQPPKGE